MVYIVATLPWEADRIREECEEHFPGEEVEIALYGMEKRKMKLMGYIKRVILIVLQTVFCLLPRVTVFRKVQATNEDVFVYSRNFRYHYSIEEAIKRKDVAKYACLCRIRNKNEWQDFDCSKPELEYFEYHVAWHCNLQCKGCSHYSNLQDTPLFGNLAQFKKDLHQIHTFVRNVRMIRLMGEPLLNPELVEFIYATKKEFPCTHLRVVSNGLLIPTCEETIFDALREVGGEFDVSQYPPTQKIVEKIEKRCRTQGVRVNISPLVTHFLAPSGGTVTGDIQGNFDRCSSSTRKCNFLYDGKMALCGMPIWLKQLGDKSEFQGIIEDSDIVDLYDPNLTSEEFYRRLTSPMDFCKYCIDRVQKKPIPWECGYRKFYTWEMVEKETVDKGHKSKQS